MTDERIELGRYGEELVASMLKSRGWKLIARNVRLSRGELDLIAREGDTLVFVEVKTLRVDHEAPANGPERAVLAVDYRKRSRIRRLAGEWLAEGGAPHGIAGFRFDVVGVEVDRRCPEQQPRIEHIEGAF